MNKTDLVSITAAIVLTAGLVSCSREEKSTDSYKAPPPVIVTHKGSQDFLQWDRESDKTLDLQSSFDLSAGNPARLEIVAHCKRDKQNLVGRFTVNAHRPLKIFQVIPQDLLFDDLSAVAVECGWELTLFNEVGSRHIMTINNVLLADQQPAGVTLENPASDEKIKTLHASKMNGVKLRYSNQEPAATEVICRDVTFDPLQFEKVLDLNQFDLRKPHARPGKSENIAAEKPLQSCRVVVSEAGAIRQISALIQIQIPRRPLEIKVKQILPLKIPIEFIYTLMRDTHLYAEALIKNPDTSMRTLRIPKSYPVKLDALLDVRDTRPNPRVQMKKMMELPWMHTQISTTQAEVKDAPEAWLINLQPNGELLLRISYVPDGAGCYRREVYFDGYALTPRALPVMELSEKNEVLDVAPIELPIVSSLHQRTKEAYEELKTFTEPCL